MKKLLLVLASCGCVVAFAETYTLTVDSGEQTLADAMTTAYPDATLAADDTIVKKGAGVLKDSADMEIGTGNLNFDIREGVVSEGVPRTNSTYTVAQGASVALTISLVSLNTADFTLCGSGTTDYPGALYLAADSGTSGSAQHNTYTLSGDAVIYTPNKTVNLASTSGTTTSMNKFYLNGHTLTFRQQSTKSGYFRFRCAVNFFVPGTVVFDNCRVTHSPGSNVAVKDEDGNATTLPLVKLVNGAKLNLVDQAFAGAVGVLDCETGTTICKVGSDTPTDYTLACLKGYPTVSSDQTVTIKRYVACAADLKDGKSLSVEAGLTLDEGCGIEIDDFAALDQNVSYTLMTSVESSGAAAHAYGDFAQLEKVDQSLVFTRTKSLAEHFVVDVPTAVTRTLTEVTNGCETSAFANKTLLKVGYGLLDMTESLENVGFTNLVVAGGVYRINNSRGLPCNGDEMPAWVQDGASICLDQALTSLSGKARTVRFNLVGQGFEGRGALNITAETGNNTQYVTYNLLGDTLIGVDFAGAVVLSGSSESSTSVNRFYMNGYNLTFRGPSGNSGYLRFRYAVNFDDPGEVTFDHIRMTHHATGEVHVYDADGVKTTLPRVRFVNNCKVNFAGQDFPDAIEVMDCEAGTKLCGVNAVTDKPTDYTIHNLMGAPEISAEQAVTIEKYTAKAADVNAGKNLVCNGTLTFAEGATVEIDDPRALDAVPETGVQLATATEGVTGKVKKGESLVGQHLSVRLRENALMLYPSLGLMLFVR